MTENVGVVGLGYVGLPLALAIASKSKFIVTGFDIDKSKIAMLVKGESYLKHLECQVKNEHKNAGWTADFGLLEHMDVIIICVPTPLNDHREPDITPVIKAGETVGRHLKQGAMVILESTTYPGCTDEDLRSVLERESKLTAGKDFNLVFSPEREDPGNPVSHVSKIPKVVGGLTEECRERAREFYASFVERVVQVRDNRTAEAVKILENIFRAVNIALVNEMKVIFDAMDIDVWEVINAAKTKPYGYMPFYPGPGLGGHCIPIDPFYLTWKAREFGKNTKFIELAGEINTAMPEYVVAKVMTALNQVNKPLKDANILVIGIAYKPNIEDCRESPSFRLIELLELNGASCSYHDPYIPEISHKNLKMASTKLTSGWISGFDCVLIATNHSNIDYKMIAENASLIVDTRNAMNGIVGKAKVVKS